ncbi:MAG TPA: cytochrome c oxidase subunit II [Ktedonobacterales bacterium]|nr:cytochrome c oxidase subunit II [Ktedonobacterales bacterium]
MSEATVPETAGGASPARTEPHHLRRAVLLWIVLSILGIAIWLVVAQFILPTEITDAGAFDNLTIVVFTVLAIPVAMFVWVFLGYSLFVFRTRERPTQDGIRMQPRLGVQVGWLGVTSILCLFLVIWGMFGLYQETSAASNDTLIVQVTGQQWLWTFYYPKYQISSAGQVLELPVNQPVQFEVTSKDVLHGFSIQALGVRVDANPGQTTTTQVVTPTAVGDYQVVCVELCGLYHTFMWSAVRVVSQTDFNAWIQSLGGQP